ncbi:17566_t:CDS:2 [Funneliformis caledonium]|uniref:17566_t:CDS:1 n=1 Tax=Funneliformis caledonium TaxID=1117310 RepID=A0A9N9BRP5_9GLOM|nr:17566_t:CDS:2 [Funneliformis caledonium]
MDLLDPFPVMKATSAMAAMVSSGNVDEFFSDDGMTENVDAEVTSLMDLQYSRKFRKNGSIELDPNRFQQIIEEAFNQMVKALIDLYITGMRNKFVTEKLDCIYRHQEHQEHHEHHNSKVKQVKVTNTADNGEIDYTIGYDVVDAKIPPSTTKQKDNTNVDPTTEFMEILDPTKGIMNDNTKVTLSKRILEIEKFNFEIKKANKVVYGVPRSFQEITDRFEGFIKEQAAMSQESTQEIMDPEIEKSSFDEINVSQIKNLKNIMIKRVNMNRRGGIYVAIHKKLLSYQGSSKQSFTDANVTWDPAPNNCNISESSNSSDNHYLLKWFF